MEVRRCRVFHGSSRRDLRSRSTRARRSAQLPWLRVTLPVMWFLPLTLSNLPPPDFSVASSPASMTVTAGQSGTSAISIAPQNGFNSAVSFSCSGLPSGASCSFSPATVSPSGASAPTTLTIATSTTTAALRSNRHPLFPTALAAVLFCLGLRKMRRLQTLSILAVCTIGLGLLNGCGGGSSGSGSGGSGGGNTQPVTSTITVTATSGTLQHTATISLTVN